MDADNLPTTLDNYKRPVQKIALLSGTPGVGKTTLAHIVARHAGYYVQEMNARYVSFHIPVAGKIQIVFYRFLYCLYIEGSRSRIFSKIFGPKGRETRANLPLWETVAGVVRNFSVFFGGVRVLVLVLNNLITNFDFQ